MLMMKLAGQCNQGRGESCYELRLFLTPLDAGQARALMQKACDLGLTEACEKLGESGIFQLSR